MLREAYRVLKPEFIQIDNIDVFLESATIAAASNKVMRKRFVNSNTMGLISPGGYIGNVNYSNKAIMGLVYREQTYGCTILHARNGREYRHVLPRLSVDGFCAERTVYEFFECLFHGYTFHPFVTSLH